MESELHKKLKNKAVHYLYDKSYWICRPEVGCGYYGIYDAWGMKLTRETMGIEVKVSRQDYRNHRFKEHRLEEYIESVPAERNYILCPSGLISVDEIHPAKIISRDNSLA